MNNLETNISNLIKYSKIDIKALNEFLKREENGGDNFLTIKEDGQIIYEQKNPSFLNNIKEKWNFIKNFILKLLGIINEEEQFCGIMNISNNCYLNAGLQILSRCHPLFMTLFQLNYEKNELLKLFVNSIVMTLFSKNKNYNPIKFIKCFCKLNKEFVFGQQNCSQNFIRTILRNINEITEKNIRYESYYPIDNSKEFSSYKTYITENKIFPESKAYSLFSGMLKMKLKGECSICGQKICNYTFSNFVDYTIYLDSFSTSCNFSDVLRKNIGEEKKSTMKCQKCGNKIYLNTISKFVKIPEILIFTLERYVVRNKVPVEPDDIIDIHDYVDQFLLDNNKEDYKYELFAINIRIGRDTTFGHEICQIKEKDKWYTIDDNDSYQRQREFNDYSYGLFYRKMKENK